MHEQNRLVNEFIELHSCYICNGDVEIAPNETSYLRAEDIYCDACFFEWLAVAVNAVGLHLDGVDTLQTSREWHVTFSEKILQSRVG